MQIPMQQGLGMRQELLAQQSDFKVKRCITPERYCFISYRFVKVIRIGITVRIVENEVLRYFTQLRIREVTGTKFFQLLIHSLNQK